ncbi:MAG: HAMP domain-containing histidine kinase [Clostridiales bacterium]|jgi:signal transduction histidine kinase|nr:HAMP domain-containing histidine kinase [Clostridiales bacterium]
MSPARQSSPAGLAGLAGLAVLAGLARGLPQSLRRGLAGLASRLRGLRQALLRGLPQSLWPAALTLRAHLSLAIALVALVTVALAALLANAFVSRRFESYVREQHEKKTAYIVENLGLQYRERTRDWNVDSVYSIGMYAMHDGYFIHVDDAEGASVWDAANHDMEQCAAIMGEISERMGRSGSPGEFVAASYPLYKAGARVGDVTIQYYGPFFLSESDFSFLSALNAILLAVSAVAMLVSLAIGRVLARRISRPLAETAEAAKQISVGNYAHRFDAEPKTLELRNLAEAIGHMSAALEKQEGLRRQLTADIAHELRTPIAVLSSHLETMIDGIWAPTRQRLQSCHEEIARLGGIVADLERLERLEQLGPLSRAPADLMEIARGVCANFDGAMAGRGLKLEIGGEPSIVAVDKDRIGSVVVNLVSNAVKYTPDGGRIRVTVRDSADCGAIAVEDTGAGIPKAELPLIFERFYRADKSRNRGTGGTGIGLAIVKSAVAAHGGTVEAQSEENRGSLFTVTLPKNAP